MQVLKNLAFGLTHGFILLFSIAAVELIGLFGLAMPVAEFLKAQGYNGLLTLIGITALAIVPVALAWKPLLRYTDWFEKELRRRERLTCKACTSARSTRAA
jgi:hypothetical protein